MGTPPWIMWGSAQQTRVRCTALPTSENIVGAQLSQVSYGRPDTWSFFFAASIVNTPKTVSVADTIVVSVTLDLVIGVGRTQKTLYNFAGFAFKGNEASLAGRFKWTTATRTPPLDETATTPADTEIEIRDFPAQSIVCNARLFVLQGGGGPAVGELFTIEAQAWFAPRTHVRPEWMGEPPRFPAGENKGM